MYAEKYDLSKLEIGTLQKILKVLKHLKQKSELEGKEEYFTMGEYMPAGMNKNEYLAIIDNLDAREYIDKTVNYGILITIDKRFYDLLEQIPKEITKRKLLLQASSPKFQHRKPYYDPVNKMFSVNGFSFKIIKQQKETTQEAILKLIFLVNADDLNKVYEYSSVVIGKLDFKENLNWNIFRNAFRELNQKIFDETNGAVENFFDFGKNQTGSFRINPEYL
jgi:hypothetical protein